MWLAPTLWRCHKKPNNPEQRRIFVCALKKIANVKHAIPFGFDRLVKRLEQILFNWQSARILTQLGIEHRFKKFIEFVGCLTANRKFVCRSLYPGVQAPSGARDNLFKRMAI